MVVCIYFLIPLRYWKGLNSRRNITSPFFATAHLTFTNRPTDCKNLAPVYEELASNFQHAESKVNIAKLDADEHKDLARKYGVQGFPTLKWFDGKSKDPSDYSSGRDLDSLSNFITEKTGLKPRSNKPASQVRMLKDSTFNDTIGGDEHVLVAFTAPWCGRKDLPARPQCPAKDA